MSLPGILVIQEKNEYIALLKKKIRNERNDIEREILMIELKAALESLRYIR